MSGLRELPAMDVTARATRVREALPAAGVDAFVVTRLPNVRYLTGFTGSAGTVVLTPDALTLVTDGRYAEQSRAQLAAAGVDARVVIGATVAEQHGALAGAAAGCSRVGLEADGVTWALLRTLTEAFAGCELVPTTDLVEAIRRVKEPAEVARIRAACAMADDALAELVPTLADGPTEREFALALEVGMRRRGASGVSFDPIVAAGPNGAQPHARPSERPIGRGELVVVDFGCVVDGYCSDMTRTVSVGDPGPEATHIWETVLASQQAGRAAVGPGVECAAVDGASRAVIEAAGFGDRFVHGPGHGVGLEIHEAPRVARTTTGTLAAGYVVTVEPGVYLPGVGGVRIEDTLVVTTDGAVALTEFPKQLVV
ncbi:MAG: M24 family metallopeptidase [Actinomycetota bacterium]